MNKFKVLILAVVVIALLIPATSALAYKTQYWLTVRNRTGGDIVVDLFADTKHNANVFIPGLTQILVKENVYDMYVSTPCGNTVATINFNFKKTLFVGCKDGSPYLQLDKQYIRGQRVLFTP